MTKSNDHNELIPAEQVEGCESWQMPDLAVEGKVLSSTAPPSNNTRPQNVRVMPLTASKIEAMQRQAQQEGFEQGKQEGYQAGLQQAQAEMDEAKAQLNRIIGQLVHPLADQDSDLEQALVNLAMVMAKSVVKTDFEMDANYLVGVARQAIAQLPEGSQNVRVLMHPRDAEMVKHWVKEHTGDWLVIDASMGRGGCIVKTDHSYVDFTLEQQFRSMVEEMFSKPRSSETAENSIGENGDDQA